MMFKLKNTKENDNVYDYRSGIISIFLYQKLIFIKFKI